MKLRYNTTALFSNKGKQTSLRGYEDIFQGLLKNWLPKQIKSNTQLKTQALSFKQEKTKHWSWGKKHLCLDLIQL